MFDKQRRDDAALRRPRERRALTPVLHHTRLEPLPQQLEHPPVRDAPFHELHQLLAVDASEVVADVGVEHVVAPAAPSLRSVSSACVALRLRPEAVRARKEVRLEDRLQHQLRRHLHHPVPDRRNAQRPLLPIGLRDVPAQHRCRPVRACAQLGAEALRGSARPRTARRRRASEHRRPPRPRFLLTRFHASARTSRLAMRSYSAWKRRPGCRLAATHSRRWSCRTLSAGVRPRGWLGPDLPAMPSRLPPPPTRPPQGPFPPAALFFAPIAGTTAPSDSRCAALAFAFGLYEPPCRDDGDADGPPVFRTSP